MPMVSLLGLLALCSCSSANYDMRAFKQPVLFNSNPCLLVAGAESPKLTDVDHYTANVNQMVMAASSGGATVSSSGVNNQAQVNAFRKIGGQNNLVIRGVSLEANHYGVNAVFMLIDNISLVAAGKVSEVSLPVASQPVMTATPPAVTAPTAAAEPVAPAATLEMAPATEPVTPATQEIKGETKP